MKIHNFSHFLSLSLCFNNEKNVNYYLSTYVNSRCIRIIWFDMFCCFFSFISGFCCYFILFYFFHSCTVVNILFASAKMKRTAYENVANIILYTLFVVLYFFAKFRYSFMVRSIAFCVCVCVFGLLFKKMFKTCSARRFSFSLLCSWFFFFHKKFFAWIAYTPRKMLIYYRCSLLVVFVQSLYVCYSLI